jgi:hypothetical protein
MEGVIALEKRGINKRDGWFAHMQTAKPSAVAIAACWLVSAWIIVSSRFGPLAGVSSSARSLRTGQMSGHVCTHTHNHHCVQTPSSSSPFPLATDTEGQEKVDGMQAEE